MFIASCPECGDSLTFPSGVALSSRCRCPLCTETFTLEECLSELPPMAELLDGDAGGSGFSPAYGGGTALATAPRTATASSQRVASATAGSRAGAGRAPARKAKGGNPVIQMAQIVVGGAVGVGLAVLIIWWGLGKDPFNLAPTVARYAPFLVPAKFQIETLPVSTVGPQTKGADQVEPLPRDAAGGVKLDSSRFGLDDEQPQPGARRGSRSSLDPDAGELSEEPVVDTLMPELDSGGAFGSAFEEPSLDSFALPDTDLSPASDPAAGAPDASASEPVAEEPMVDAPEEGAFSLEPFSAEPGVGDASSGDPFSGDPAPADAPASANDPFALVFPTATEDLTDVAAAEAEAWEAYSATTGQPNAVRRESALKHYEQLASLAQVVTGLPPSPRSNAAVADLTATLADRFAKPDEWKVANFFAKPHLLDPDLGLSGVIVVGRVDEAVAEGERSVVSLTLEGVTTPETKHVVAVVRESQGLPEEGSIVAVLGVKHAGPPETLPASLAGEKAPIVLAGAVAPVGGEPESEAPAVEEMPAPETSDTEPAPTEPAPDEPASEAPAPTEPTGDEPAPAEPSAEEPAPAEPAPVEPASPEPSTEVPAADPAPEEPAPTEEGSDEEPAPAAPSAES